MNTLDDQQETKPAWVRRWKKVIMHELARQLQPDGDVFLSPRRFYDDTDQASFESACYELRRELDRRAQ